MKKMVLDLPNREELWRKFLWFDRLMSQTISRESRENHVKLFLREGETAVTQLADLVIDYFGL